MAVIHTRAQGPSAVYAPDYNKRHWLQCYLAAFRNNAPQSSRLYCSAQDRLAQQTKHLIMPQSDKEKALSNGNCFRFCFYWLQLCNDKEFWNLIITFVCSAEKDNENERKLTHPAHVTKLYMPSSQTGSTWIATVTSTNPKVMLVQIYRTGRKPFDTRVTNTFTDYLKRSKRLPSTLKRW